MSLNFIAPEVKFWRQKFTKFNFGGRPRRGRLRRSSRFPSRLGRGCLLPIPAPLDAFGISISAPSAKYWLNAFDFLYVNYMIRWFTVLG